MHAGGAAMRSSKRRKLAASARRRSRHSAEPRMPMASENRKVSTSTNTIRQNSPRVTPPRSSGMASTGNTASNP